MPAEYRAIWSTPGGGTGYSVFHFNGTTSTLDPAAKASQVRQFFDSIKGIFPDDVTISFDDEVRLLGNDGTLLGVVPVVPGANVVGINTSTFNKAAGARVDWQTATIVAGRRLVGRTYLVPCGSSTFDTLGNVSPANVTVLQTHGNALITAATGNGELCVWSRTHQVVANALSATAPTKGAILRGRRD